ncbi:MAG: DUF4810 domain-containing protein [Glaciecola sp.]|jgi:hypothetical protein|nr:DUF4810 domain-containing protein [Glaciecola sp.]MDG1468931.1 DUF4810 domain-containing protein [Glaciecola sp.]MDG1923371.1 DUF4810 domain-containing protein [Glaciecola sp.]
MTIKLLSAAFVLLLAGCGATAPPPLYYYGDYPATVYQFFKSDETSTAEQIEKMVLVIAKSTDTDQHVAPGVHAHLGMLYFESGNPTEGEFHFRQEKILFPESSQFIDFLLAKHKG